MHIPRNDFNSTTPQLAPDTGRVAEIAGVEDDDVVEYILAMDGDCDDGELVDFVLSFFGDEQVAFAEEILLRRRRRAAG